MIADQTEHIPEAKLADVQPGSSPGGLDLATLGGSEIETSIRMTLERLYPIESISGGDGHGKGRYNGKIHADICRLGFLGLADATICGTIGISTSTLKKWTNQHPKLASDLHQARGLAVSNAALRLKQIMMSVDDSVALAAVKYFLDRRAKEFKDKKAFEVSAGNPKTLAEDIRREMYGLDAEHQPEHAPTIEREGQDAVESDNLPAIRL